MYNTKRAVNELVLNKKVLSLVSNSGTQKGYIDEKETGNIKRTIRFI